MDLSINIKLTKKRDTLMTDTNLDYDLPPGIPSIKELFEKGASRGICMVVGDSVINPDYLASKEPIKGKRNG